MDAAERPSGNEIEKENNGNVLPNPKKCPSDLSSTTPEKIWKKASSQKKPVVLTKRASGTNVGLKNRRSEQINSNSYSRGKSSVLVLKKPNNNNEKEALAGRDKGKWENHDVNSSITEDSSSIRDRDHNDFEAANESRTHSIHDVASSGDPSQSVLVDVDDAIEKLCVVDTLSNYWNNENENYHNQYQNALFADEECQVEEVLFLDTEVRPPKRSKRISRHSKRSSIPVLSEGMSMRRANRVVTKIIKETRTIGHETMTPRISRTRTHITRHVEAQTQHPDFPDPVPDPLPTQVTDENDEKNNNIVAVTIEKDGTPAKGKPSVIYKIGEALEASGISEVASNTLDLLSNIVTYDRVEMKEEDMEAAEADIPVSIMRSMGLPKKVRHEIYNETCAECGVLADLGGGAVDAIAAVLKWACGGPRPEKKFRSVDINVNLDLEVQNAKADANKSGPSQKWNKRHNESRKSLYHQSEEFYDYIADPDSVPPNYGNSNRNYPNPPSLPQVEDNVIWDWETQSYVRPNFPATPLVHPPIQNAPLAYPNYGIFNGMGQPGPGQHQIPVIVQYPVFMPMPMHGFQGQGVAVAPERRNTYFERENQTEDDYFKRAYQNQNQPQEFRRTHQNQPQEFKPQTAVLSESDFAPVEVKEVKKKGKPVVEIPKPKGPNIAQKFFNLFS